jgi:RimJ/RimL family protein N-acetyltransferase
MIIQTPRMELISCNPHILEDAIEGDQQLSMRLNARVPSKWTSFGSKVFQYVLEKIRTNPEASIWWTYFPILIKERVLIGNCGYKGAPDEKGIVEIGYEVSTEYRSQGFGTEIALALIQHAFTFPEVKSVTAHTLAEESASTRVLEKCGMVKVAELSDRLDGQIWKWNIGLESTTYSVIAESL